MSRRTKAPLPPEPHTPITVLVMAGGTGGHVYPALAVAESLRARGNRVAWLGTRSGLEARVVPPTGIQLFCVRVSGLRRRGLWGWLWAPFTLCAALLRSGSVIARVRPHVVLGMGGFVTGPGGVAAWLLRRPLLIHEQNAVPGLTNRLLARLAVRVMEAFPGSFPARCGAVHTGNPVRAEIARVPVPEERFAGRTGALRVLVLGGSQGARALNEVVPAALAALADRCPVTVCHQAGPRNLAAARAGYAAAGVTAQPVAFIEDMARAYAWADVVVCRAGAMTIAELAATGVASILVPFPYAVDDHQTHNARYLAEAGAALLLRQAELTAQRLASVLAELCATRERLLTMARAARTLAVPDAAARVMTFCLEAARA